MEIARQFLEDVRDWSLRTLDRGDPLVVRDSGVDITIVGLSFKIASPSDDVDELRVTNQMLNEKLLEIQKTRWE